MAKKVGKPDGLKAQSGDTQANGATDPKVEGKATSEGGNYGAYNQGGGPDWFKTYKRPELQKPR